MPTTQGGRGSDTDNSSVAGALPRRETVLVDFDVPVQMRDGVILRANVFRPDRPGRWPTLLVRTPYDKNVPQPDLDTLTWARNGFLVVVQDVRGRFASGGIWEPFRFEGQDGYDSIEWAAGLPNSNGLVGMSGASYCGNVQWLAAGRRPPSLVAISPSFTWSDSMDGLLTRGGALELGLALFWALENGFDVLCRSAKTSIELDQRTSVLIGECDRLAASGYWALPANGVEVLRRLSVPTFTGIRQIDHAETAQLSSVAANDVSIPSFHTGGWYDIFLQGTLDNFVAMRASGQDVHLMVGPWCHEVHRDPIGQLQFGVAAAMDGVPVHQQQDWTGVQMGWFAGHVVPNHAPNTNEPRVRIFVMGRNHWRDENSWPPERAQYQHWHFGADGALARQVPENSFTVEFQYDPVDPVPTVGGHGVAMNGYTAGPIDQSTVEARSDVVVFTSEPMIEELEVTGPVRVVLYAQSSAPSTDWVARLCDVHPDGRSFNLCDGIIRVTNGAEALRRYEIDLWSTSNVFMPGHCLRVHITSSSFPRWDRNLNTGRQHETDHQVARQRIHIGASDASYIDFR